MGMNNKDLYFAIKHFHPKAKSAAHNGVISRWDDPDGAEKPDEITLVSNWEDAGRPKAVRGPSRMDPNLIFIEDLFQELGITSEQIEMAKKNRGI